MAFSIIYTIADAKGSTSTTEVNLPAATDFADVVEFAADMAVLINDLIQGVIRRIGVAFTVDLPVSLRDTPVSGSDVEEGARFQFITDGGFFTSLRLPTFDESNIAAGGRSVDTADTAVAAFVTAMEDGIDVSGTVVEPCDKREEDVLSLSTAREQFLSSRREE